VVVALALVAGPALSGLTACPASEYDGVPGEEGVFLFDAANPLVFENRVMVGSSFHVTARVRRTDDEALLASATFGSSDESVLEVGPAFEEEGERLVTVTLVGPGEASLLVSGADGELDRIGVRAAQPVTLDLLDAKLVGSSVDARLPERFALTSSVEPVVAFSATDRCGFGLVVAGGVTPTAFDTRALGVQPSGDGVSFQLVVPDEAVAGTETALSFEHPALTSSVSHDVTVLDGSDVDEVDVVAAAAEPGRAEVWARAFSDDLEVIGLDYSWSGSERVTLSRLEGPNVLADISFPAEGEPADDRPALVSGEVFGEEGELDLFSLQTEAHLVTTRVPDAEPYPTPQVSGCSGEPACDPYLATLPFGLWLAGRLRRKEER
jgi:hypothetical protein